MTERPASAEASRILSLDVIRGVAVMGIFSVNVIGMAMIERAYFYPPDFGFGGWWDKVVWAANFIIVDGRFRSLFSILFGASMLLVIERAEATGRDGGLAHYARMIVLLLFGLAHYYLLWWGDILTNYAIVGMLAFTLRRLPVAGLLLAAAAVFGLYYGAIGSEEAHAYHRWQRIHGPSASVQERAQVIAQFYSPPSSGELAEAKAKHRSIAAHAQETVSDDYQLLRPINAVAAYGIETLGLMLLGMAGYKSGFLTGAWRRRAYLWAAAVLGTSTIALHLLGASTIVSARFDPLVYALWSRVYLPWAHPLGAVAYAAAIILLMRPGGAITRRVSAVGRAAFTNYLGATVLGTLLFFDTGLGLFGTLSRAQAWLVAPAAWALMLLWSEPWLQRYRYGPFEWAWRSLSRWRWEPMRKVSAPATRAAESPAA